MHVKLFLFFVPCLTPFVIIRFINFWPNNLNLRNLISLSLSHFVFNLVNLSKFFPLNFNYFVPYYKIATLIFDEAFFSYNYLNDNKKGRFSNNRDRVLTLKKMTIMLPWDNTFLWHIHRIIIGYGLLDYERLGISGDQAPMGPFSCLCLLVNFTKSKLINHSHAKVGMTNKSTLHANVDYIWSRCAIIINRKILLHIRYTLFWNCVF